MGFISKYKDKLKANLDSEANEGLLNEADRKYHRNVRDPERNEQSTPEENIKIYLPSIWVFEAYPPSYINGLVDGFTRLDLVKQIERNHHRNILDQLNIMRSTGYRSSWYNLGIFVPPNSTIIPSNEVGLPDGIKYASSHLHQFVPSTTILATQFHLNDDLVNSLETPLRKYYDTYPEKTSNGFKLHSPILQKQEAYNLQLEFLRTKCTRWISEYFPGLFSSNFLERDHPTVELILLENDEFMKNSHNSYESYLNIMGFNTDYDMYKSTDLEGLFMTVSEKFLAKRSSMTIGGNIEDVLSEEKLEAYGDKRINSLPSWLAYLSKTLSFWSLTDIVFGYDQKLKDVRDELGAIDTTKPDKALEKLQNVESKISNLQMNSLSFANEIIESVDRQDFKFDMYEFEVMSDRRGKDFAFLEARKNVLKRTAESVMKNNEQLDKISNRLSQLLTNEINLKLSESNNRLQFWILILTIIVVVVTILSQTGISLQTILNNF